MNLNSVLPLFKLDYMPLHQSLTSYLVKAKRKRYKEKKLTILQKEKITSKGKSKRRGKNYEKMKKVRVFSISYLLQDNNVSMDESKKWSEAQNASIVPYYPHILIAAKHISSTGFLAATLEAIIPLLISLYHLSLYRIASLEMTLLKLLISRLLTLLI